MLETVAGDENQNRNVSKTSISDKECGGISLLVRCAHKHGTGLSETKNTSSGL